MVTTPTPDQLRALAACEALLDAPGFRPGEWVPSWRDGKGLTHMPWYRHSPELLAFLRVVGGTGIELDRLWMDWAGTPRGRRLIEDPDLVAGASADELVSLLTACIRGDRFSEGNLAAALEKGTVRAILRRAGVLASRGAGRGGAPHGDAHGAARRAAPGAEPQR